MGFATKTIDEEDQTIKLMKGNEKNENIITNRAIKRHQQNKQEHREMKVNKKQHDVNKQGRENIMAKIRRKFNQESVKRRREERQ